MDIKDIDIKNKTIKIFFRRKNKGGIDKQEKIIPDNIIAPLQDWLKVRGNASGKLFVNFNPTGRNNDKLSGTYIYLMIVKIAKDAGLGHITPKDLRKAAIFSAITHSNGNVQDVALFAGFKNLADLIAYFDETEQVNLIKLIASSLKV